MTAFAALFDNDSASKADYQRYISKYFTSHYTDNHNRITVGELDLQLNISSVTPVSLFRVGKIEAFVLGHVDASGNLENNHAKIIANHFIKRGFQDLSKYSGYFLAILFDGHSYYITTDRLGLFPCYYSYKEQLLLFASSPELPCFHQKVNQQFNTKGLIGHLLYMHEVLGETLWKDSRRLGTGIILKFDGSKVQFIKEQSIPVSDDYFGLPYDAHLEMVHETMLQTFTKLSGHPFSLLFSGGLDSRTIAAYLDFLGIEPNAVYTIGFPTDQEFKIAQKTCKALKWNQTRINIDYSEYQALAYRQINHEQLANGLNDLSFWSVTEKVQKSFSPLINGFIGDPIIGGTSIKWAYIDHKDLFSIKKYFSRISRWGLSRELVNELIPDISTDSIIKEINNNLYEIYNSLPGYEFQKIWQFHLMNRLRYHIAGTLRRFTPAFWPVTPFVYDQILTLIGGMPASTLSERKLQRDIIIKKFPQIAHLPVDNNSLHPYPLKPSIFYRMRSGISHLTGLDRFHSKDRKNLHYYRVYDINNDGWRSLRKEAYTHYKQVTDILDYKTLNEILPDPVQKIQVDDGIIDTSGRKTVLGFILWHKEYAKMVDFS